MLNFGNKEFRNLQEQVLENAKNIEILKERPSLKVVVVNELPATGEVNILYLVPKNPDPDTSDADSYDEYVWLPETQTYEFVGSTAIDLSNMVNTDTEQTITGAKTFTSDINAQGNINVNGGVKFSSHTLTEDLGYFVVKEGANNVALISSNLSMFRTVVPSSTNNYSLGRSDFYWKDLYLAGQIKFSSGPSIKQDSSNRIVITGANGADRIKIGSDTSTYCAASWTPDQNATYDLGSSNYAWKDLYISNSLFINNKSIISVNPDTLTAIKWNGNPRISIGNVDSFFSCNVLPSGSRNLGSESSKWKDLYLGGVISDGTNSVAVADIATKPNYANPNVFASGTLDANGEGTIDISAQGVGMPSDGLYMFTYGNAQCFIALTSTMIQNATLYPMRCPCPVLKESGGVITGNTGNLKISRNADTLTIKVASTVSGSATSTNGWGWQLIKVM